MGEHATQPGLLIVEQTRQHHEAPNLLDLIFKGGCGIDGTITIGVRAVRARPAHPEPTILIRELAHIGPA